MSEPQSKQKNGKGQATNNRERIYQTLLQVSSKRCMREVEVTSRFIPDQDCRYKRFGQVLINPKWPLEEKIQAIAHQIGHNVLHHRTAHAHMTYELGMNPGLRERYEREAELFGKRLIEAISYSRRRKADLDHVIEDLTLAIPRHVVKELDEEKKQRDARNEQTLRALERFARRRHIMICQDNEVSIPKEVFRGLGMKKGAYIHYNGKDYIALHPEIDLKKAREQAKRSEYFNLPWVIELRLLTIAHELGHFFMHIGTLDLDIYNNHGFYYSQVEQEANEYGQRLIALMEAGKRVTTVTLARLRREVESHVLDVMKKGIDEERINLEEAEEYLSNDQRKWTEPGTKGECPEAA